MNWDSHKNYLGAARTILIKTAIILILITMIPHAIFRPMASLSTYMFFQAGVAAIIYMYIVININTLPNIKIMIILYVILMVEPLIVPYKTIFIIFDGFYGIYALIISPILMLMALSLLEYFKE